MAAQTRDVPEGPYKIVRTNEGVGTSGTEDWSFCWKVDSVEYRAHDRWPGIIEAKLPDGSTRLYASDHPDRDVYLQLLAELATCPSAWEHRAGRRLRASDVWSDEWPELLQAEGFTPAGGVENASGTLGNTGEPAATDDPRRSATPSRHG